MKVVNTLLALAFAALAVGCASTPTPTKQQPVAPTAVQSTASRAAVAQAASAPVASKPAAPATTTKVVPVDPSTLKSLQPFAKFAKGEGEGMARVYKTRDKAAFVDMLRDPKRAMRIDCAKFVGQIVEAHPGLTVPEGCGGFATMVESSTDFAVVACEDQMFVKDNWLTVTNEQGSAFGAWHRKCLAGERVLTYKGQVLASTTCLNVAVPVSKIEIVPAASASKSAAAAPAAPASCPNGHKLFAHLWDLSKIRNPATRAQAEALIAAAKRRESDGATRLGAYTPDVSAFSRTMGQKLREEEPQAHATIDMDVPVRLLDPVSLALLAELEPMKLVAGKSEPLALSAAQREKIVETIWTGVVSPTMSGDENRLRLIASEWTHCRMHQHGAVRAVPGL